MSVQFAQGALFGVIIGIVAGALIMANIWISWAKHGS